MFKAHRLLYRPTVGSSVIKKKKKESGLVLFADHVPRPALVRQPPRPLCLRWLANSQSKNNCLAEM